MKQSFKEVLGAMSIIERRGSKFDVREDEDDTDLSSIPMGTIEGHVSIHNTFIGQKLILFAVLGFKAH